MPELTAEQHLRERCLERVLSLTYIGDNPPTCTLYVQMAEVFSSYIIASEISSAEQSEYKPSADSIDRIGRSLDGLNNAAKKIEKHLRSANALQIGLLRS